MNLSCEYFFGLLTFVWFHTFDATSELFRLFEWVQLLEASRTSIFCGSFRSRNCRNSAMRNLAEKCGL